MRGSNQLVVNENTVKVAMQEYLERRWSNDAPEKVPEVIAVEWDKTELMFTVFLVSEAAPVKK